MKETLITFPTAKLAKDKGFKHTPSKLRKNYYNPEGELNGDMTNYIRAMTTVKNKEELRLLESLPAPTQSSLQDWLRESKDCMVWVEPFYYDCWYFKCHVIMPNGSFFEVLPQDEDTWSEILETGLQKALKELK